MKKILILLIAFVTVLNLSAQTVAPPAYADVNNDYRNYMNNVFGTLEASRVPTGLLMDYAFSFTNPKIYNGSVLVDSTLMNPEMYSQLYKNS